MKRVAGGSMMAADPDDRGRGVEGRRGGEGERGREREKGGLLRHNFVRVHVCLFPELHSRGEKTQPQQSV